MTLTDSLFNRRRRRFFRPLIEALEVRLAPAVNVFISGGVLFAIGNAEADTITIDHSGIGPSGTTIVTRSAPAPTTLTFADSSFTRIEINPGGGPFGDTVNIWRTSRPTSVTSTGFVPLGFDVVNIGSPTSGTRGIFDAPVGISNAASFTTINVNDSPLTTGRTASHRILPGGQFASIDGLGGGFHGDSIQYRIGQPVAALNIRLGSGTDTFTFHDTVNVPTTLDTGGGIDNVIVERTGGPLTVTGISDGNLDRVEVGNDANGVRGILGPLTALGPRVSITINNEVDTGRTATYNINTQTGLATLSGLAPAAISYQSAVSSRANIILGFGADTFTFGSTQGGVNLITGAGDDTVHVQNTGGSLGVSNTGGPVLGTSGLDIVNVGNPANGVQGILRTVFIDGGGTTINVNNGADTAGRTATHSIPSLSFARIRGLAPADITYRPADLPRLTITLGSGSDTFTFENTVSGRPTTLNAGPGDDVINIQGTGSGGSLLVDGGPGDDAVNVGTRPGGSLDPIAGPLTINGRGGSDTITFKDGGTSASQTYTLTSTTMTRGGMASVRYGAVESLMLSAGSGNDRLDAGACNLPVTLVGNGGLDVLIGGSAGDQLVSRDGVFGNDQVFGNAGDDTADTDAFDLVDLGDGQDGIILRGTSRHDRIRVGRRVGPHGAEVVFQLNGDTFIHPYVNGETVFVHAGKGDDEVILDASAAVRWHAEFFGEQGDDYLVGSLLNDILDGGPGHDILMGGDGDDLLLGGRGRDLLIGGLGRDHFLGSEGSDLLIDGFTAFDSNRTALTAILAEWTSRRDYIARIANLRGEGSGPRLNASFYLKAQGTEITVFDDGADDTLTGGPGRDWFFAQSGRRTDRITDRSLLELVAEFE